MAKFAFTQSSLRTFFEMHPDKLAWDETQRGLAAYATGRGQITLFVQFRVGARQRKKALGRLGELSIQQARTTAAEYGVAGRHGRDVLEDMRKAEHARITLGDAYLAHRESLIRRDVSNATLSLNAAQWTARLAKHHNRPLSSLTRGELREWHDGWRKFGPTAANNTARMLRTILNFAIKKLDVDIAFNPASAIEFFPQQNKRTMLELNQIPAWWAAVDGIENPNHRAYFKLLLFTGLRRTDAATIKLADIHEDHLYRPNPKGGIKRAFSVPMTPQLKAIIAEAMASRVLFPKSEYLFPANGKAGRFCGTWHQALGISPHALRRTYASACIAAGLDLVHTKALLNHTSGSDVTLTSYIKLSLAQKTKAAEQVANFIEAAIGNNPY